MPFSFTIDTGNGVALFRGEGVFSSDDLLTCFERVGADPAFKPEFNHLVDLRLVTVFEAGSQDVRTRSSRNHGSSILDGSRVALVSSGSSVYGMTRMYETLMSDASATVRTFRDINAARAWLGLPPESKGSGHENTERKQI